MTGPGADQSDAPELVWRLGTVPVDGEVIMTFRSTVRAGLAKGTRIKNQALAKADQSPDKHSDAPQTAAVDDATLLRTGANDWWWAIGSLLLLLAGAALVLMSRRHRRA
jgi:LPXTG-motif cell wall-anchored protein